MKRLALSLALGVLLLIVGALLPFAVLLGLACGKPR